MSVCLMEKDVIIMYAYINVSLPYGARCYHYVHIYKCQAVYSARSYGNVKDE